MRRGVMRRAEWPRGEYWMARVGEAGDAVHRARGERLRIVERRKNGFEGAREHRLAGSGRADEQKVVTARRGEPESVLRRLLSGYVREVDGVPWRRGALRHRCRRDARATLQMVDDVA
jgi:hypothetical protein